MAVSNDSSLLVTISRDQSVKVFDVPAFDMVLMLKVPFVPKAAEWVFRVRCSEFCCLLSSNLRLHASSCAARGCSSLIVRHFPQHCICRAGDMCNAQRGQAKAKLAISDAESGTVHIYDARSGSNEAIASVSVHRQPVQVMRYNEAHDAVISVDAKGAFCVETVLCSRMTSFCSMPRQHPCCNSIRW